VDLQALEHDDYDEFGYLQVYAEYSGVPWEGRPVVRRESVPVGDGLELSAVVWGEGEPEVVFLHGGGQNAHTWDTVSMSLGRPAIAVDLPGHGRSFRLEDGRYSPATNAEAVAELVRRRAPEAEAVVGMSLGGLTAIRLAAGAPDLVRNLVVVDITPNAATREMTPPQRSQVSLIGGQQTFDSFREMLEVAAAASGRTPESMAIGVRHNARREPDGRWSWAYDPPRRREGERFDVTPLWDDVAALSCAVMLVRGGAASSHVHDDDVARLHEARPDARVEQVEGAGHSIQSERPVELADLIEDFVFTAR
jgi:pimeloyl-ACP methyl ester carboxylesterase